MKRIEILAPAGAHEQLLAAVRAQADAVYLGFGDFNARRNAQNFGFEELKRAVTYCHMHGVKVHVAFNTLVLENELEKAREHLRLIAQSGADAVIVQDLGIAHLVKECVPSLEMHASTQCAVHNVGGAKIMEQLGFSRIVLARELSLGEIKKICENTSLEVEVFVHGALCMCLSGNCYLSSVLGQRSGNRGLCAQPCRLDFTVNNRSHALSLKDMSHIDHLRALADAGVTSFKIEGRMKRPEYVFAAVDACKKALEGEKYDRETLKAVFSRSGFTDGYLQNRRNISMFGFRTKDDVTSAEGILAKIRTLYRNEIQNVPVKARLIFKKDTPVSLELSCKNTTICVSAGVPQEARTSGITKDELFKQLNKTGSTAYFIENADIILDEGLFMPVSEINALRRKAFEALDMTFVPKEKEFFSESINETETSKPALPRIRFCAQHAYQIDFLEHGSCVILPEAEITPELAQKYKVIVHLPVFVSPFEEDRLINRLKNLYSLGIEYALCENIGGIFHAKQACLVPLASNTLNVLNSLCARTLFKLGAGDITVSFESSFKNFEMLNFNKGFIGYGFLPLMQMRTCPAQTKQGCANCTGLTPIVDRKNISFTLMCNEKKYTTLLNSLPLYVLDQETPDSDFITILFTKESKNEAMNIAKNILSKKPLMGERTKGLYYKTLR